MALQDLTPQLRTRLSRLERLVGWFVTLATLLLLFGLCYYVYQVAQRRGWFLAKMPYYTFVRDATGLKVGDRVRLMGFDIGQITEIQAQPPNDPYFNVFVGFRVNEPYYGYIWEDSRARVGSADFLGNRFIEVTKGTNGAATYAMTKLLEVSTAEARDLVGGTNNFAFAEDMFVPGTTNYLVRQPEPLTLQKLQDLAAAGVQQVQLLNLNAPVKTPDHIWDVKRGRYDPIPRKNKGYWVESDESPALTERLERVVNTVERALPDFLAFTNRLARILNNGETLSSNANETLVQTRPIITNLAQISTRLTNPDGSLGQWLLPTNLNTRLEETLVTANTTLTSTRTNLTQISTNLVVNLENLAGITSNLHAQVQLNTNLVTSLNGAIIHADQFVQGLKRHWLLRSAFKEKKTNQPPRKATAPADAKPTPPDLKPKPADDKPTPALPPKLKEGW